MGYKFRIQDDTIRSYLKIDTNVNGKRYQFKRRYNKDNKQEAFKQLSEIQQKLVQEFTVDWEYKGGIEAKCIVYFSHQRITVVFSRNALYMHFFEIGSIYTFSILELLKLPKIAQISTPVRHYCAFLVGGKMAVILAVVVSLDAGPTNGSRRRLGVPQSVHRHPG